MEAGLKAGFNTGFILFSVLGSPLGWGLLEVQVRRRLPRTRGEQSGYRDAKTPLPIVQPSCRDTDSARVGCSAWGCFIYYSE